MTKCVSYVSDEAIEKDAQALLAEYAHARGVTIEAPIAIDDIIEKYLKIGIEFDDTHRLFGVPRSKIGFDPDILGAIFFEQKRIVIDESLDPDENPAKEGRYRYTAAHEVGHWRLHRHLFGKDPAQTSMLDANAPPSVICRTSQAKARIELQADLYASCVLMPRKRIFAAWDEAFPDRKQRVLQPSEPIDHPFVEIARFESRIPGAAFTETDDRALESFAKPFAETFLVSPIAMRIRLRRAPRRAGRPYRQKLRGGWGTWIRTKIDGVRVRCSTIELFPTGGRGCPIIRPLEISSGQDAAAGGNGYFFSRSSALSWRMRPCSFSAIVARIHGRSSSMRTVS